MNVGNTVKTLVEWPGVPKNTEALIIEDYGSGIMIAWDLPDRPLQGRSAQEIFEMKQTDHEKPLTDGFDKEKELHYLQLIN